MELCVLCLGRHDSTALRGIRGLFPIAEDGWPPKGKAFISNKASNVLLRNAWPPSLFVPVLISFTGMMIAKSIVGIFRSRIGSDSPQKTAIRPGARSQPRPPASWVWRVTK